MNTCHSIYKLKVLYVYKFVFIIQPFSPVFHCLQLFLNLRTNHLEEQVAKNMMMMITKVVMTITVMAVARPLVLLIVDAVSAWPLATEKT